MQYQNNLANGCQDIVWKRDTDTRPDMLRGIKRFYSIDYHYIICLSFFKISVRPLTARLILV